MWTHHSSCAGCWIGLYFLGWNIQMQYFHNFWSIVTCLSAALKPMYSSSFCLCTKQCADRICPLFLIPLNVNHEYANLVLLVTIPTSRVRAVHLTHLICAVWFCNTLLWCAVASSYIWVIHPSTHPFIHYLYPCLPIQGHWCWLESTPALSGWKGAGYISQKRGIGK